MDSFSITERSFFLIKDVHEGEVFVRLGDIELVKEKEKDSCWVYCTDERSYIANVPAKTMVDQIVGFYKAAIKIKKPVGEVK